MSEPKLIKAERSYYVPTETWYCKLENETGSETDAELETKIQAELVKIRPSAPAGSIAEVLLTKREKLIIKMKNLQGGWTGI